MKAVKIMSVIFVVNPSPGIGVSNFISRQFIKVKEVINVISVKNPSL